MLEIIVPWRDKVLGKFMLLAFSIVAVSAGLLTSHAVHADDVPGSVEELWGDFDPRKEPLATEVIREWKEDGV